MAEVLRPNSAMNCMLTMSHEPKVSTATGIIKWVVANAAYFDDLISAADVAAAPAQVEVDG